MTLQDALQTLLDGRDLSRGEARAVMDEVMRGEATQAQIAGFLVALRAKGETADEIAGCAEAMREHVLPVHPTRDDLVDTAGTGGDGAHTFNISTAAALVAAAAGAAVAKHGNRAVSSASGSADLLEALGLRLEQSPERIAQSVDELGFGFMFAPAHHPAFRHVVPVRTALGVRTVFNLLGPLTNPAGAPRQLIGVFDRDYIERIGGALTELGCERAMVVSGHDGMDEISTAAPTDVAEVRDGRVRRYTIEPRELGFAPPPEGSLAGGEPAENARTITSILAGEAGPRRDLVVLNAAAVIAVAGEAADLEEGVARASESIDSGAAAERLEAFIAETQRLGDHTGQ